LFECKECLKHHHALGFCKHHNALGFCERERERSDVIARILVTTVAGIEVFFFTVRERKRQSLATVFI